MPELAGSTNSFTLATSAVSSGSIYFTGTANNWGTIVSSGTAADYSTGYFTYPTDAFALTITDPTGLTKGKKIQGIHPLLYFKFVKSKIRHIETSQLDKIKRDMEKAFDEAVDAGQTVLAEKFLANFVTVTREKLIVQSGITKFIEDTDLKKYKYKLAGGRHIADTKLKDYTRHIPADIRRQVARLKGVFDDFIIYHYWEETAKDVKQMSNEEKTKMRDPIIFGIIKESNKMYFIADWEDDYCDLTFRELTKKIGKERVHKLNPKYDRH